LIQEDTESVPLYFACYLSGKEQKLIELVTTEKTEYNHGLYHKEFKLQLFGDDNELGEVSMSEIDGTCYGLLLPISQWFTLFLHQTGEQ